MIIVDLLVVRDVYDVSRGRISTINVTIVYVRTAS